MDKKYKVLLLNPPSFDVVTMEREDISFDDYGRYAPLGLLYIATYLRDSGLDVDIKVIDSNVMDWGWEDYELYLREEKPDLIGLGSFTPSIFDAHRTLELIKKCLPESTTVMGGVHATLYPKETLSNRYTDIVVAGEAEISFKELVEAIINKKTTFDQIDGVSYKNNGKLIVSKSKAVVMDLDLLPPPDRTFLPYEKYTCVIGKEGILATVMSSRGCPHECTYCNSPSSGYRYRSPMNIIKELEQVQALGISEVLFFDDMFNLKKKNVYELCELMKERNMTINWSFRGTIKGIDDNFLKIVKSAGCERIQFGVESSSDELLKKLKKNLTVKAIREAIRLCKKNKITTVGNFLIGLPDDTEKTIKGTFAFAESLPLDFVQYSVLIPYPFTEIYEVGIKDGLISHDYWREFAEAPFSGFEPQIFETNVKRDRLYELMKIGFKSFYFRPVYVFRSILKTRNFTEFKKRLSGLRTLMRL